MRRTLLGVVADQVGDLGGGAVGVGLRQVDLVHERDDLEVVLDRQVRVRERLRLDPLRRVDHEQRSLARLQRARDLVGEVHVTGRIDQVQLVPLPEHAHGLRLDRDPALALELHRVEQLLLHVAVGDGVGELQDAIGQRRLPMVDVGDDREVADVCLVHACQLRRNRSRRESSAAISRTRSARQSCEVDDAADDERRAERDELGGERAAERARRARTRRRRRLRRAPPRRS